jgi:hypothetical protein
MGGIKMIEKDFEFLIWHAQEGINVKDFVCFLKQLDNTGFNYSFSRKGNRIIAKQEKSNIVQRLKRFFSKNKRLKLNQKQEIVFKKLLKERQNFINFKTKYYSKKIKEQQIINNYPCWVKRALTN